ncbi:hypothetical protein [Leptolinea tardivitalis]|nr:hypothetical protein [Leptolinea tardivitalis]
MKKMLIGFLSTFMIVASLFSVNWNVVNAQGTIPYNPPPIGGPDVVIPVTGGTTATLIAPDKCENVVLEIANVGRVEFIECPKPGTAMSMVVLTQDDIKPLASFNFLTEPFQVTVDEKDFSGKMKVGVFLAESEKEALKKDPDMGLYHFDPVSGAWTRIVAALDGDYLSAETNLTGIFVVGKPS